MNRVVISGLGMTTAHGADAASGWEAVSKGQVTRGPASYVNSAGYERARDLVFRAMDEALNDAGLGRESHSFDSERVGCTVSASKPLFYGEGVLPDVITNDVRARYSLHGEARNVIAACATGPYSVATAASWIEEGLCDLVVAGSVEPWPHELIQAGFQQMGVVSADGHTRPFDAHRSGFHFGEGAGILVLESETHAKKRNHEPHARLSGWALGADGHSTVAFNSNGQRIADVIGRACRRASLEPSHIGHVNAHGTATPLNDWIETQALEKAFGPSAQKLAISATKGSTGHLLGAAGSVELVLTVLALQRQFVPPTAELETPDPQCRLDYTRGQGRAAHFTHALSLSFGFGGPIGAVVISR